MPQGAAFGPADKRGRTTIGGGGGGNASGTKNTPTPSIAGGATAADKYIEDKYINSPAENPTGSLNDRGYWNAVNHLGQRYADYKDIGNSALDNFGNFLAGMVGVGEMDPTRQKLSASIDSDNASWGIDPLHLALSGIGMATGLPVGTLYRAAKLATGYPGPQIAFDGKQYMDYGMPSSPIAQGGDVYADGGHPSGMFSPGASAPSNLGKGNGGTASVLAALAQTAANTPQAPSTGTPTPITPAATPITPPQSNGLPTYDPYADDYATYGQRPEHPFFIHKKRGGQVDFGPGVEPEYRSIGGFLKKLVKHVAPAVVGAGVSALTGSDIIGGISAGIGSKLLGNSWLESGITGLGTGLFTNATGLSGDQPGPFASIGSDIANSGAGGTLDFVKNNPAVLGAGALGLAALLGSKKQQSQTADASSTPNPANDPAYADQIRKGGWNWGRTPTDTSNVDWYQYGQLPEWDFFNNENQFTPKAKGGAIPGTPALGGALDTHGGQANGPGGGQDDKIPVYLSAKEYVVPADVVSDLGDGNPDEGARKLDGLRNNVRKQKGRKGFPPKAKPTAEHYL